MCTWLTSSSFASSQVSVNFFYLSDTGNTTRRCLGKSKKTFNQIHSSKKQNTLSSSLERPLWGGPGHRPARHTQRASQQSRDWLPVLPHGQTRQEQWVISQCPAGAQAECPQPRRHAAHREMGWHVAEMWMGPWKCPCLESDL
jgi:hypothetical protein